MYVVQKSVLCKKSDYTICSKHIKNKMQYDDNIAIKICNKLLLSITMYCSIMTENSFLLQIFWNLRKEIISFLSVK